MRVFIINDTLTTRAIKLSLTSEDIICDIGESNEASLNIDSMNDYDIVILDLEMPSLDGFEILLRLRGAGVKAPIFILSELDDDQKILNHNTNNASIKQTDPAELIHRIQSIIHRLKDKTEKVLKFDRLSINLSTKTVEVGGKPLHLTNKEYTILEFLALRRGNVLTKELILNQTYGGTDEPDLKIIDVFVCKLRRKLFDASGGINYIYTIWGRGYMFKDTHQQFEQKEKN